jgi:3-oxoacyl-[acyl-carrier-protein] synthase III
MAKNAVITGWGFYAPSRVVTNQDLEKIVDTTDEWITSTAPRWLGARLRAHGRRVDQGRRL